jgi:hypothetical protein
MIQAHCITACSSSNHDNPVKLKMAGQDRFDLTRLDANTSKLDLEVVPTKVLAFFRIRNPPC